ncbi:MAG TPA: hypothetical protein VF681_14500 [Abditibacteriaceae bacterium]|jgi:Asp-tRNA(Asn)/Glu-tRNA(Gln) amidotransferase B subunit
MSEAHHQEDESYAAAMEEALEGETPSAELLRMSKLLRERRARLAEELTQTTDEKERQRLEKELKKSDEGARVLLEEAQINQFVEDAVRVGIEMRKLENQ